MSVSAASLFSSNLQSFRMLTYIDLYPTDLSILSKDVEKVIFIFIFIFKNFGWLIKNSAISTDYPD